MSQQFAFLGEWLVETPAGVKTFSEQQLRRLEPEHYPDWVPKDSRHRPDGYWHRSADNGNRTVALEVEIVRKKAPIYQSVGSFYGDSVQVNRVLWVVRNLSDAKNIQENLEKGPGSRKGIHSFVILNSFLKQGWSALIEYGSGNGLNVESFLIKALGCRENEIKVNSRCEFTRTSLLETRKTGIQSATLRALQKG